MKILAVDDDSIILGLLTEVLESAEYGEVQTCTSAERALEVLSETKVPFDCFLLDIQMGGMDGIALCARIRDMPHYARTPILMLTAMSEKSYIDRAFAAGATDYLSKPFDPTEIIVRLGLAEQLMQERRSLAEAAGVVDSLIEVLDRSTRYDLEEAIDLGKMDRLLRYPAFENYLYQSGRGVLFLSTVFAAKIRNVGDLHRKLPPLEFKNLLGTAAGTLIGHLAEHEVFVTYRGEGEFVGVVPRRGQQALKLLRPEITFAIEESEGRYAGKLPAEARLVIGPAVPVRLPTRGELNKAIWSAVEKVRFATDPLMRQEGRSHGGRDWAHPFARLKNDAAAREDSLRDEFKEMLRDQLSSEIGEHPKSAKAQTKPRTGAFMKREGATAKKHPTKLFPNAAKQHKAKEDAALPADERAQVGGEGGGEVLPMPGDGQGPMRFSNA
ncbi:MAG: response regulator [Paracoccaceae bacterium]|nr:response regulator [Maritimibacter sp.]